MSTGRNTVTMYLLVVGGLLVIGLVLFAPLPTWGSLTLGSAFVAVAIMLAKSVIRGPGTTGSPRITVDRSTLEPAERRAVKVTDVPLPSRRDDYVFMFSATVLWSPLGPAADDSGVDLPALAVEAVLRRACEFTLRRDPDLASFVGHELGVPLGTMRPNSTGKVQAMATSVRLHLPDHDRERLDKLATVRKERVVWEHERTYEQSRREYLVRDVLKDPGSAVVWWLAKNDGQVEKTVQDIPLLSQLTSAANNERPQDVLPPSAPGFEANGSVPSHESGNGRSSADHFDAFLRSLDFEDGDPNRDLFTRRIADVTSLHGRDDVADEIARRHGGGAAGGRAG